MNDILLCVYDMSLSNCRSLHVITQMAALCSKTVPATDGVMAGWRM
jgi:hypothetical protein